MRHGCRDDGFIYPYRVGWTWHYQPPPTVILSRQPLHIYTVLFESAQSWAYVQSKGSVCVAYSVQELWNEGIIVPNALQGRTFEWVEIRRYKATGVYTL